jgi:hypothetical protein
MSGQQIKLMNALKAKHKLSDEEEELLQELEYEYSEKEDVIVKFLQQIED